MDEITNLTNEFQEKVDNLQEQNARKLFDVVYKIAEVCHEVNKAYCESIGDFSQPSWIEAPDWQKQSATNGVIFHFKNPDSKPCDSHNNWMKEKIEDGWVYGEVKNPETKEHPCLVPYEQLPKEQQTKDALFIAVVRTMIFEIEDYVYEKYGAWYGVFFERKRRYMLCQKCGYHTKHWVN